MRFRRVLGCVAAVVVVGLGGCSGSDAGESSTAAPAQATVGSAAVDPGAGQDVCAHLSKELPRIKAVGSEVGAMAQLTMSLAGFYENHPKVADGTVLDEQTEKACPEVRAEILAAAGMQSFEDF
jgi:hypothetical protein